MPDYQRQLSRSSHVENSTEMDSHEIANTMSNQNSEISAAMQQAIELLKAGQTVQAEEIMVQTARAAEQQFGPDSPRTANAYNELGTIFLNVDNIPHAVHAFRRACAGPLPTEEQPLRDRLTFLMNLGMALQSANLPQEAEEVLLQGLKARAKYYGAKHPGYAFGLEPLATLLMRQGRLEEAVEMFQATVKNFWNNRHPRVATALVLHAEALKRAGREESAFAGIEQLPDEVLQEIVNHVVARREESDPGILSSMLQELLVVLKTRFGEDHWLVVNTLIWIANLEALRGKLGNIPVRVQAAREVIASQERQGKLRDAVHAFQGLALALSDADQPDEAVAAYSEAAVRAGKVGDLALQSQLRRNFGLLLSDLKRDQEAEAELRASVEKGQQSANAEMLSRARIALGIFHQHRRRLEEARPLLSAALQDLNPAHSDAVIARSHLQALEAGKTCGCENQSEGLAAAFREFVLGKLPQDLLQRFDVSLENNDFKLEVHLKREPTQEELDHLNRVVTHALTEFRQQLRLRS